MMHMILEIGHLHHAGRTFNAVKSAKDRVVFYLKVGAIIECKKAFLALIKKLRRFNLELINFVFRESQTTPHTLDRQD